uniref:RNA-directed RNA polymerase n=1 Tax=Odontella aurita TaxID=265563 RepID=A0A7S4HZE7_9STRA
MEDDPEGTRWNRCASLIQRNRGIGKVLEESKKTRLPSDYVTMAQRRNRYCHEGKKLQIHLGCSRLLFGAALPELLHDFLDEGQCLVFTEMGPFVGTVIVSRSPSYCTGDVRVLEAVSPPPDRATVRDSLRCCVLFATRGGRPEADRMSGGDMDGDQYLVIWDPRLIRHAAALRREEAECYDPLPQSTAPVKNDSGKKNGPQCEDWIGYAARFDNSMLGVVDSAFHAIAKERGVKSEEARELNRLFSSLVDKNPASLRRLEELVGSCYLPISQRASNMAEEQRGRCVWEDMLEQQRDFARRMRQGSMIPKAVDYSKFCSSLQGLTLVRLREDFVSLLHHFESCIQPGRLQQISEVLTKRTVGLKEVQHDEVLKHVDPSHTDLEAEFVIRRAAWKLMSANLFAPPLADWDNQRKEILSGIALERRRKQEIIHEFVKRRNTAEKHCRELKARLKDRHTFITDTFLLHEKRLKKDIKIVSDELNSLSIFYLFSQKRQDLTKKRDEFKADLQSFVEKQLKEERIIRKEQNNILAQQEKVDALDDELESFLCGELETRLRLELDRDEECLRLQSKELNALVKRTNQVEGKISRLRDKEQKIADSLKKLEITSSELANGLETIITCCTRKSECFTSDMLSETSYLSLMHTFEQFQEWGEFWRNCLDGIFVRTDACNVRQQDCDTLRKFFSCAAKARKVISTEEINRREIFEELSQSIDEMESSISRTRTRIKRAKKNLQRKKGTESTEEDAIDIDIIRSKKERDEVELRAARTILNEEKEKANDLEKFLELSREYGDAAAIYSDAELVGGLPESIFIDTMAALKSNGAIDKSILQKFETEKKRGRQVKTTGCFVYPDKDMFFAYSKAIEEARHFCKKEKSAVDDMIQLKREEMSNLRSQIASQVEACAELRHMMSAKEETIKIANESLVPRRRELSHMFSAERLKALEDQWEDTGLEDSIDIGARHIAERIQRATCEWYSKLSSSECDTDLLKGILADLDSEIARVCDIEGNRVLGFSEKVGSRKDRLVVYEKRAELQAVMSKSNVVVVTAGTGCGKSTQIPQYIADDFYMYNSRSNNGNRTHARVCCTQPRRAAAQGVASRVAKEYQTKIGGLVGFRVGVRGNNVEEARKVSAKTQIEFVTEGWLLYHLIKSPCSISNYDCIIVDEAHERNKETDLLLALLRRRLQEAGAPLLKVVVMSASIDPKKFCEYFGDCPTIDCPGKMHEVQESYRPPNLVEQSTINPGSTISTDHVVRVLFDDVLGKFGSQENFEKGDCLVFLSGSKQIEECVEKINALGQKKKLAIAAYPLYAQMQAQDQQAAINKNHRSGVNGLVSKERHGYVRKIICCTNIAETSLTIDGVRFVLEGGHAKKLRYDHSTRCKCLKEELISRASAKQRRGRAGRTESGWCFYLYSCHVHENMHEYDKPQILETAVDELILFSLDACGESVEHLGLIDCPDDTEIATAKERLCDLEMATIDEDEKVRLTKDGELACRLSSIEPEGVRMVLAAQDPELNCFHRALKLAVLISSPDDIFTSNKKNEDADEHTFKTHDLGDHLLALEHFEEFEKIKGKMKKLKSLRSWCKNNGMIYHAMNRVQSTVENCYKEMKKRKVLTSVKARKSEMADDEKLLRACVAGYFSQTAECIDPCFPKEAGFAMIAPAQKSPMRLQLGKESCLNNLMVTDEPDGCWITEDAEEDCERFEGLSIHFVLFGSLLSIRTRLGRQLVLMQNASLINGHWIAEHAPQSWCQRVRFDPDKPSVCRETISNIGKPLLKAVDNWINAHGSNDVVINILWNMHQIRMYGSQECISSAKQSILATIERERHVIISKDSVLYYSGYKEVPFHQQTSTLFGCGMSLMKVTNRQSSSDETDLNKQCGRSFSPSRFDTICKHWHVKQNGNKLTIFVNRGWDTSMFHHILLRTVIGEPTEMETHVDAGRVEQHARTMLNLALLLDPEKDVSAAKQCIKEAITCSPGSVTHMLAKAGLLFHMAGQSDMALDLLTEQPSLTRQSKPSKHKLAHIFQSLGTKYIENGDHGSSLAFFREALKIRQEVLPNNNLDVASTMHSIGRALFMCESFDEALTFYEGALRIREKRLGRENEDVSDTREGMGAAHYKKGNMEKAMQCFHEALRVREILLRGDSEKVAITLHSLGRIYEKKMPPGKAMECYEKSLLGRETMDKLLITRLSYEALALASKHRSKFSAFLNNFGNIIPEHFPLGVYDFKVNKGRIEAELVYPFIEVPKHSLFEQLSTSAFLSPGVVTMTTLPETVLSSLNTFGIDQFSEHLWHDLWSSLRCEWASSNPFWRKFCRSIAAIIPEPVNIAYVPSREVFEIYAARSHTMSNAKGLLLRQMLSMCFSTNYLECHPVIEKYTPWKLWGITSMLEEMRLEHKSVRFSLKLITDSPNCRSSTTEENSASTMVEEGTYSEDDCLSQVFGSNDFEKVEKLYENGYRALDIRIFLQTSASTNDLEAAYRALVKKLPITESGAKLQPTSCRKERDDGASMRQTPVATCCMCRRKVSELNMGRKKKSTEKNEPLGSLLRGWRLTLCGCIFCRSCFVSSVLKKLKAGDEAQCYRCGAEILAKDCLNVVKPRQMEHHEKEAFEWDWKMLSTCSSFNFFSSMVDMRGAREDCAVCDDCQMITVFSLMKPFFACRNSWCPNIMCTRCKKVPPTEEAFKLCKKQHCLAVLP